MDAFSKNKTIFYTPVNPVLLYKSGVRERVNHIGMLAC